MCCHLFLFCNTITKEDNGTLLFSSSQTQRRQNTQNNNNKNEKKGGNLLSSSHSAFSLLAPTSTFLFQTLSPDIFFFSSKRKKKKRKENHKNKIKCREGKELSFKLPLCPVTFGSRFCLPISALLFQTCSLNIFFFWSKWKEKKPIEMKRNAEKGRSFPSSSHFALSLLVLAFALPLCLLTFNSCFCFPTFALLFQTLYFGIFFFSSRKKENKS